MKQEDIDKLKLLGDWWDKYSNRDYQSFYFGNLEWMDGRVGDDLRRIADEAEKETSEIKCTHTPEERIGETHMWVCNICGKPTRDYISTPDEDKNLKKERLQLLERITMAGLFDDAGKQIIYGTPPSKSNCYVIINFKSKATGKAHSSLAKTSRLKQYEKDFYIQCNQYRNKNMEGYFQFEMDVYYPNQKSDLDNSLKVVLDCLQQVNAFKNDNLCTRIVANKFLDKLNPRIEFTIKQSMP